MPSCNHYDQVLLLDRSFSAEREATNRPKGVSSTSTDPFEMDKQHTNPIYTEEYGGW